MQGPQILVGAFLARQEGGGRKGAEKFSRSIGVDRPSVRTDERCYTYEGVGNGIRWGEICGDGRTMGEVQVAACADGYDEAIWDHEV